MILKKYLFLLKKIFLKIGIYNISFPVENFFSDIETLEFLLQNKKSFIRFGDGEINLILGKGIYFQKYEKELSLYLKKVFKDYTLDSPYLIGVPVKYLLMDNKALKKINKFCYWGPFKVVFKKYFKKECKYGDSFLFYRMASSCQDIIEIFCEGKEVILIGKYENLPKQMCEEVREITYIPTLSKNAFTYFKEYKERIENILLKKNKKVVLLFCCGPLGKVLAFIFSNKGYRCLDIGQYFDLFLPKCVKNKK